MGTIVPLRSTGQAATPLACAMGVMFHGENVPYKMNEKQFEAVSALESFDRYDHFISKVADWEQLWGAKSDEGWLVPVAPEDFEYFPLWPHPEYAQKITDENFPGHTATEISLEELIDHWLPLFEKDKELNTFIEFEL